MSPKLKSAVVKTPQQPIKRRRVKKLHKDLLEQLEFYLSEASLRHDSFLRDKAGERGMECIPIYIFLMFPLIKEMDVDEKNILTAVENSRLLQITRDRKHIQRIFPVTRPPHNLDRSTLYIENLPPDATIEWLKEICLKVGAVRHITMPRYKRTGAIKGFAFIEFATPEDVARACRIFKDPPISFYPNRTEKYLKYLNRIRPSENMDDSALESSPVIQGGNSQAPQSAESCLLSRSLDSALDFEFIDEGVGESSSGRKRKRRSRASSELQKTDLLETVTPTHTPAKKLKSLPTKLKYEDCAIDKGNCAISKRYCAISKEDCAIPKGDFAISRNAIDTNSTNNITVSMATTQKRSSRHKVLFSVGDENLSNKEQIDHFCQKLPNKLENTDSNNKNCEENGIPCDAKLEIRRNEDKHCQTNNNNSENHDDLVSGIRSKDSADVSESEFTLKRRRSCSEPSDILNSEIDAKRSKEELVTTASERPITVIQEDTAHNNQPIMPYDIDAIITQGRQQANKLSLQPLLLSPEIQSKRFLHSVVARPEDVKKSGRKNRKSRKSSTKNRARQTPPQLNAMSKIQWIDLKKEYKHLQKQNMSRLKVTLRECKDAGSVFIKKHLDVLKDVNTSNDSIQTYDSGDETNINDKKTKKRGPPTFKPGVIVQVSTIKSASDVNDDKSPQLPSIFDIKSRLNKYGQGVAYVEINLEEKYGFVRFTDGDSAQRAIMEEKSLALCLLTGESEERYWDKLLASRAQKFARERPKVRGRTKILTRVEGLVEKAKRRHIRFDNDFAV